MIHTETYKINNQYFVLTWSDTGYIKRDGIIYTQAYDPIELNRTYVEVDGYEDNIDDNIEIDDSTSTALKEQIRLAARYASV